MGGRRQSRFLALAVTTAVTAGLTLAVAAGPASARAAAQPAASGAICASHLHPKLAARLSRGIAAAVHGRSSLLGLAAADPGLDLSCRLYRTRHFDAASVIKVTIISALLYKIGGPAHLTKAQRLAAWRMITESDNNAANTLWFDTGSTALHRFLAKAKMTHTELASAWGLSQLTAQDELTLLKLLSVPGKVLSTASRRYVLWLMANVISSERWGTPSGAPSGVTVHVKNGWLPYPTGSDWHINSLGIFTGHDISYQIAMLTSENYSEGYGIDTIQAAAHVINTDLAQFRAR
jgi:beta-lactamase class A